MSTDLTAWAIRHHVSLEALVELRYVLGHPVEYAPSEVAAPRSEAAVSNDVRLEASGLGIKLWRNNVGAGKLEDGSFVRWGLCNDSAALNKICKSADLIGIRPVEITQAHVGHTIGQFVSRECKRAGWKYTGSHREIAQLRWAETINSMGGDAKFATGPGTL